MVQVVEQIRVEAPSERVWAVLADLGGVAEWNPTVDHAVATSEASGGLGAARSAPSEAWAPSRRRWWRGTRVARCSTRSRARR